MVVLNLQPEYPGSADFEEPVLSPEPGNVKLNPELPQEATFDLPYTL
jgi:hypothetical protein